MNVEKTSKTFKPVNFEEAKRNGVKGYFCISEKIFFYRDRSCYARGKHKHTVMYNRGLPSFDANGFS
jgi:hypothetical protein